MTHVAEVERWQRVRAIFERVIDEPVERWNALVTREAAGDVAIAEELRRLLDAAREDRFQLDRPLLALGDDDEGTERLGQIVARYRLVRQLGHGGMGTVYEGVRADGAYEQRVAVKLIRPHLGAADMSARFRRERQILAALEHPHIARLLDGGATEAGEPFFVMEYVEGTPITTYCDAQRLTIRDRIALFLQACSAVQHAHGRLVVHRDLKPANVLVTPAFAGEGAGVKLLDFGIAQLLGTADDGDDLLGMPSALRPLTPEYASPEQLRAEPASAASDVYSLGVILYELLAGRRPLQLAARTAAAALHAIDAGAPPPSAAATDAAATNASEPSLARLRRRLAGDLDAIVARARHTDPAQRYTSVERLADDVQRYLDGRAVAAHPDRLLYRSRKFARRHWRGVAAVSVALLALVGGATATAVQGRRAERERAKAARINGFLQDMLSAPDTRWYESPTHTRAQVTVLEVLDDAARRAGADLASQPDVEADVRRTLGRTYHLLSRRDDAYAQLARALDLDRQRNAPPIPDIVSDLRDLGLAQLGRGQLHAADTLFRAALALCDTHGRRADTAYVCAHSLNHLGMTLIVEDDLPGAERLIDTTLALARAAYGPAHPSVAIVLGELGDLHDAMGDLPGAERRFRESLAIFAQTRDREFGERASSLGGLALVLESTGRLTEAESLVREEIGVVARTEGPQHPDAGLTLVHLGAIHRQRGQLALARDETARGLAILKPAYGPGERYFTKARTYEALMDLADGRPQHADSLLTATLPVATAKYAAGDPRLAEVQQALGQARVAIGRPREAVPFLTASAATYERRFGPHHPLTITAIQRLAHARFLGMPGVSAPPALILPNERAARRTNSGGA